MLFLNQMLFIEQMQILNLKFYHKNMNMKI